MLKLIEAFWKICLLQLRPQDLPASNAFVGLSLGLYAITNLVGATLTLSPITAVLASIMHTVLLMALTYLVLWTKELTPRFNQTLAALAGSNAVLTFIALPVLIWQLSNPTFPLPALMLIGLTIWNLTIVGHILRHATNIHILMGMVLAVIYMYVAISIGQSLFGTPTPS